MAIKAELKAVGSAAEMTTFYARHLPGALKLSQEMDWPYRLEDWGFAAAMGHGLALEKGGEVIGTAMWWTYGQSHATAGMIIVTAAEQGNGYGARLFDALLAETQGRDVLLCSTEEGLALYERRGFVAVGQVVQHQAPLTIAVPQVASDDIRPATGADLPAIQAVDAGAIGMDRAPMVAALADAGQVLVVERAGRVAGYAIARRFGRGYVVGPCAAENVDDAKRLILAHLSRLHGQFVRIDVNAEHGLSDWLESLGLARVNQVTAMVKGQKPVTDGTLSMFALANQSFG
jgi:GNAT superfamily N-acetyltransferase